MSTQTPREIALHEIRKGDEIEGRCDRDGVNQTVRGVVHALRDGAWHAEGGGVIASGYWPHWRYFLHHRPTPAEPKGLGVIVRSDEGVEYVSVNRKPGTRRWVDAGLHEGGSRWALKWADLNPDSIEVLSEGIEVES